MEKCKQDCQCIVCKRPDVNNFPLGTEIIAQGRSKSMGLRCYHCGCGTPLSPVTTVHTYIEQYKAFGRTLERVRTTYETHCFCDRCRSVTCSNARTATGTKRVPYRPTKASYAPSDYHPRGVRQTQRAFQHVIRDGQWRAIPSNWFKPKPKPKRVKYKGLANPLRDKWTAPEPEAEKLSRGAVTISRITAKNR